MGGAWPRRGCAERTGTHYRFCSLALANPTLAERTIAQRWCSEYTLPTRAADFVEVPRREGGGIYGDGCRGRASWHAGHVGG